MSSKIGVITVHRNTNYGANLQAYASSTYIQSIGFNCKIIDYVDDDRANHLFSWLRLSWDGEQNKSLARKMKLGIALLLSAPDKKRRLHNFSRFWKNYYSLTTKCVSMDDISRLGLDTIVCGSDQIWNPNITNGLNPLFFGQIPTIAKSIAYAPSIGKSAYQPEDEIKAIEYISKMDYVSLREEQSAQYIGGLLNKEFSCVCDPVFLLPKEHFFKIANLKVFQKKRYVLVYAIVNNTEMICEAQRYAEEHQLELIQIGDKTKKERYRQIYHFGPLEFLGAFYNAEIIFTNSFHGTAFSIIFEKQFYAYDNKHAGSRITHLLSKAGISGRLIGENGVIQSDDIIDYDKVKLKMSDYIEKSKLYLSTALKAEKNFLVGNQCTGCGLCIMQCKRDSIRMVSDLFGFQSAMIDTSKCINCGACQKTCPAISTLTRNSIKQTYALKADDRTRQKSASGGAFAALAEKVLSDKGVVYGAAFDSISSVRHMRCTTLNELEKIQGVKYIQSEVCLCYPNIQSDLSEGKVVLFSGTPCQVAAVKRYAISQKLPVEKLLLVDIICHGIPSPAFFKDFIAWLEKKVHGKVVRYDFRSKKIAWRGGSCRAVLQDGRELLNDNKTASFMNVYYSGNITRECCYSCPYASLERVSDLTIGDCWGIENTEAKDMEDSLGVSMVTVNSEKGSRMLSSIHIDMKQIDIHLVNQPQLYTPCQRPYTKDVFYDLYGKNGAPNLIEKFGSPYISLKTRIKSAFKLLAKKNKY